MAALQASIAESATRKAAAPPAKRTAAKKALAKRAPSSSQQDLGDHDDVPEASPVMVPLVGQIAAGAPITAEEHVEALLSLPPAMLPSGGELFALKVRGDSQTRGPDPRWRHRRRAHR